MIETEFKGIGENPQAKRTHDLDHEVYLDHKDDVIDPNEGRINDWHTRHEDKHLEIYCDNHLDAFECRVYDD